MNIFSLFLLLSFDRSLFASDVKVDTRKYGYLVSNLWRRTTNYLVGHIRDISSLFAVTQQKELNVTFVLIDGSTNSEHFLPFTSTERSLISAPFDNKKNTIVLIHGWLNNYTTSHWWIQGIREIVNKYGKFRYQILFVDWGKTAFSTLYFPSAVNVQLVADVVAAFIRTLVDFKNAKTRTFHLIGFSLGAHISGFVGKRLKGKYRLNRITGLDPAAPLFDGSPNSRIDKGDAEFVEIVHTYSGSFISGFSILDPIGNIDFYVNGGERQPGCNDPPFGALSGVLSPVPSCNHDRSVMLISTDYKSFGTCQMVAYRCKNYRTFLDGKCANCGDNNENCALLGLWLQESQLIFRNRPSSGRYYITTSSKKPFCLPHYQIVIIAYPKSTSAAIGSLSISVSQNLFTINTAFVRNTTHSQLVTANSIIHEKTKATLHWMASNIYALDTNSLLVEKIEFNYLSHIQEKIREKFSFSLCFKKQTQSMVIANNATVHMSACHKLE